MRIVLTYRSFSIKKTETWLQPFIIFFTYLIKRKSSRLDVLYHHTAIYDEKNDIVYEAVGKGVIKMPKGMEYLKNTYEKIAILTPMFPIDESEMRKVLESAVGKKYAFWAVMFQQIIYQVFSIWVATKRLSKYYCSHLGAKSVFYAVTGNTEKECFRLYDRWDSEDFVREAKRGYFAISYTL